MHRVRRARTGRGFGAGGPEDAAEEVKVRQVAVQVPQHVARRWQLRHAKSARHHRRGRAKADGKCGSIAERGLRTHLQQARLGACHPAKTARLVSAAARRDARASGSAANLAAALATAIMPTLSPCRFGQERNTGDRMAGPRRPAASNMGSTMARRFSALWTSCGRRRACGRCVSRSVRRGRGAQQRTAHLAVQWTELGHLRQSRKYLPPKQD